MKENPLFTKYLQSTTPSSNWQANEIDYLTKIFTLIIMFPRLVNNSSYNWNGEYLLHFVALTTFCNSWGLDRICRPQRLKNVGILSSIITVIKTWKNPTKY